MSNGARPARCSLKVRQVDESGVVLDEVPRALVSRFFEKRAGVVSPAGRDVLLRQVEAGFAFLALSLPLVGARSRGDEGFPIEPAEQVQQDGRGPLPVFQLGDSLLKDCAAIQVPAGAREEEPDRGESVRAHGRQRREIVLGRLEAAGLAKITAPSPRRLLVSGGWV